MIEQEFSSKRRKSLASTWTNSLLKSNNTSSGWQTMVFKSIKRKYINARMDKQVLHGLHQWLAVKGIYLELYRSNYYRQLFHGPGPTGLILILGRLCHGYSIYQILGQLFQNSKKGQFTELNGIRLL